MRVVQQNLHALDEWPVQQRGERAGVDHQLCRRAIDPAVDVEVVAFSRGMGMRFGPV